MTPDEASQTDTSGPDTAADAVQETVSRTTSGLQNATAAAAETAETVNAEVTRAASAASDQTAKAFDDARERLSTLAVPFGGQAFEPFRIGSDAFGKGLGSGYASAVQGMAEFNSKAIAAWRTNAESTIQHFQSLASVKSVSEAIALSAEHTRRQMEALSSQTQELSALATRIMRDSVDPFKATGR